MSTPAISAAVNQAIMEIEHEFNITMALLKEVCHPTKSPVLTPTSVTPEKVTQKPCLPDDRRCLLQRQETWIGGILDKSVIQEIKKIAETTNNPPKEFLSRIYKAPSYIQHMGKTKRGNKALNWRVDGIGEFLCPSLHLVNNIYEAFGKKKWTHSTSKKTYTPAPDEFRCQQILGNGQQCSRRHCKGSHFCTIHLKKQQLKR